MKQSSQLEYALELRQRAQDLIDQLECSSHQSNDLAILEAQTRVNSSARVLERLTIQPSDFLFQLAISQQLFVCVHWLCHFKIVFAIPRDGGKSISYADLAYKTKTSPSTLKSVIRMAMIYGFLRDTEDGEVQHTPLSAAFATDHDIYNWMMYMAKETAPTVAHFVKASERWPISEDKTETAYSLSRGTDLSFFDHVNLSPERANEFGTYMRSQAANKAGTSVLHLKEGFGWASLGCGLVVDVGGGGGEASICLAETFSQLRFTVQDLPAAIKMAQKGAELLPKHIADRIQFQEHDFFDLQPVTRAAVYLMRMVLHDWSDNDCIRILTQLSSSMQSSSRIIIMDMVLPQPGTMPPQYEAILRQKDLVMKQNFNAKERELEEWEALIEKADLRIVGVVTPRGSQHSVIEVARK